MDSLFNPPPNATTSFVDFVVLPPGHGRSVTNWGWDAHEAQLCCPTGVWVVIEEDVVPGGALNLNSTNLPIPWSPRKSSPSHGRAGNWTRDLMISSQRLWPLDHEAGPDSKYIYLNINQLDALSFIMSLFHVLSQPVHRTATYRCDDTRGCIVQFWPPDDEHIVLETCRGMK